MGATTNTSTSSTAPANPDVNNTISALAKGISSEYSPGKSLYTAPGSTTTGGQAGSLAAADNPLFSDATNGALKYFGNLATGANVGASDPAYEALRSRLAGDITTQTNKSFNQSGLFGSDSNRSQLATDIANGVGGLDYQHLNDSKAEAAQALGLLPGIFSAQQLPSSVQQSVGASQDAASAAQAAGPTDFLAKLSAIAAGNAGAGGQTQTNTSPGTPLWMSLLGAGIGGAGLLAR